MPSLNILKSTAVIRSPRVLQLEGLFEIAPTKRSDVSWSVNLPLEEKPWNIGLIVGPSGSGKSTLAREAFGMDLVSQFAWPDDGSIVDGFPDGLGIKEITGLLSSVGFSSPPAWLRPFRVLSTGEQFRATIARALAEKTGLLVIDEFTSVVDRTVAQIGSAAVAKALRKRKRQLIAVSCHYDIEEWLQPDWVYQPHVNEFKWRLLRRRPNIQLEITRVHRSAWELFKQHHYLDHHIHKGSAYYLGGIDGTPAAFTAVLAYPHATRSGYREHRTVCLPDFQGVGIGNALSEHVAGLYRATGKPYFSTTSNPAMIFHRARSVNWDMRRKPGRTGRHSGTITGMKAASNRITAGFEFVGSALPEQARGFGIA
jgi:ABC-type lipoprotein export system ATPase subunit/GNAT superfamily N-acetyltransferase